MEVRRRTLGFAGELRILQANSKYCGRTGTFTGELGVAGDLGICGLTQSFAGVLRNIAGGREVSWPNSAPRGC